MTRSDLFIILGAIVIAVLIIKRAIWNAVRMVGNDFSSVFEKLNYISVVLRVLETDIGTLRRSNDFNSVSEKLNSLSEVLQILETDVRDTPSKIIPLCPGPVLGCGWSHGSNFDVVTEFAERACQAPGTVLAKPRIAFPRLAR